VAEGGTGSSVRVLVGTGVRFKSRRDLEETGMINNFKLMLGRWCDQILGWFNGAEIVQTSYLHCLFR